MLAIKPNVLGRAKTNPPEVMSGAKFSTGLSGCSLLHFQETEAQGGCKTLLGVPPHLGHS